MLPIRPGKFALDLCSYQRLLRSHRDQPGAHAIDVLLAFQHPTHPNLKHTVFASTCNVGLVFEQSNMSEVRILFRDTYKQFFIFHNHQ